jgi:hypothetical protein
MLRLKSEKKRFAIVQQRYHRTKPVIPSERHRIGKSMGRTQVQMNNVENERNKRRGRRSNVRDRRQRRQMLSLRNRKLHRFLSPGLLGREYSLW